MDFQIALVSHMPTSSCFTPLPHARCSEDLQQCLVVSSSGAQVENSIFYNDCQITQNYPSAVHLFHSSFLRFVWRFTGDFRRTPIRKGRSGAPLLRGCISWSFAALLLRGCLSIWVRVRNPRVFSFGFWFAGDEDTEKGFVVVKQKDEAVDTEKGFVFLPPSQHQLRNYGPKLIASNVFYKMSLRKDSVLSYRLMSTAKGRSMRSTVEKLMRRDVGRTQKEIRRARNLRNKLMTEEERLIWSLRRAMRCADFIVKEPMVIGHECAGIIEEVGPEVKSIGVGDRVALEPGINCWHCDLCKDGSLQSMP